MASVIDNLIQSAGKPDTRPFRERARMIGAVYTISYTDAIVAVYDYDREQAGGLPKSTFLMAAKPEGDETFVLLRIQKEARLPSAAANDQTRQDSIEDSGNQGHWSDRMPDWVRDKMSLHGLECSVLGTFISEPDGSYRYAEDIDNYYAVSRGTSPLPPGSVTSGLWSSAILLNVVPPGRTRSFGELVLLGSQQEEEDTEIAMAYLRQVAEKLKERSVQSTSWVTIQASVASGIIGCAGQPEAFDILDADQAESHPRDLNQSQGEMRIRRIAGEPGRTDFNVRTGELYLAALTCPHHLGNVVPTLALV